MRRILINEGTRQMAYRYLERLNEEGICQRAKKDLEKLRDTFISQKNEKINKRDGNSKVLDSIVIYINLLLDKYNILQTSSPNTLNMIISEFENIINGEKIGDIGFVEAYGQRESIATQIVKAMKYKEVREKGIFSQVIRDLNIRACVYCNANYTISDEEDNAYYELDHLKPKSHYPYLCTSFYNLQPSCSSCNNRKSNDKRDLYFQLWKERDDNKGLEVFRFRLKPESILRYIINHKIDELSLSITEASPDYAAIITHENERLNLTEVYKEHSDVVEEIVWKRQIYNNEYLLATDKLLQKISSNYKSERNRFILGTYYKPEDIHKRPLTKMIQDIGRQLGLL